jgi:hypothetical protein
MNLNLLKEKIEEIKIYKYLINLFEYIYINENKENIIINNNGVFIKLENLKDDTINKINEIYNIYQEEKPEIKIKDVKNKIGTKKYLSLPRQEKIILKKSFIKIDELYN